VKYLKNHENEESAEKRK